MRMKNAMRKVNKRSRKMTTYAIRQRKLAETVCTMLNFVV